MGRLAVTPAAGSARRADSAARGRAGGGGCHRPLPPQQTSFLASAVAPRRSPPVTRRGGGTAVAITGGGKEGVGRRGGAWSRPVASASWRNVAVSLGWVGRKGGGACRCRDTNEVCGRPVWAAAAKPLLEANHRRGDGHKAVSLARTFPAVGCLPVVPHPSGGAKGPREGAVGGAGDTPREKSKKKKGHGHRRACQSPSHPPAT